MIVTMKKVSLVVQTKDKEEALEALAELGLVHLEDFQCTSPRVEALSAKKNRVTGAYHFLALYKPKEERETPPSLSDPEEATEAVIKVSEELQSLEDKDLSLKKEIAKLEPWGDFSPGDLELLAEKGCYIKLYTASPEQLKTLEDMADVVVFHRDKKGAAFAHISREPVALDDFTEFAVPSKSLGTLKAEQEALARQMAAAREKARSLYPLREILQAYMEDLDAELEYQVAAANALDEGDFTALLGYIPSDQAHKVQAWARQNSIAVAVTNPRKGDPIPTLIRNPRWLEIIRPVFNFLGTVPGYRELDISPFFLAFFILFFAMIFNDAAYGAIFFLGGVTVVLLNRWKQKRPPLTAWLFTCLGLATVIWGAVTGSWFGSPELIQGTFLEKLIVPPLVEGLPVYTPAGEYYKSLTGQDVIKLFCFIIALVHLSIAQVWNFLQALANRSLKAVAQFAWIGINFGLFYLVLSLVMYFDLDQALGTGNLIARLSLILILGGLGLVVIFGYQEGNFVRGLLGGLGGLMPTALGVISAFGDIISYIRLFAVGLAGAEIARSFNGMAADLLSGNTFIFGVLILVAGHALNFVLCSLGVLVHGVRLNMLEFSGRLGLEWSGHKYNPFRERESAAHAAKPEAQKLAPAAEGVQQRA